MSSTYRRTLVAGKKSGARLRWSSSSTSYTVKLESALTAARVGFFLDQHREALMVEDKHLDPLRRLRPRQPRYLDARRKPGKLVAAWNLIVPDDVLGRTWAEVA